MMSSENLVVQVPLPLEVTSIILSKLPFQDKLNARLVCHYWRNILDEFEKYKFRLRMNGNTLVDDLLNTSLDLEHVGLRGVTKPIPSTYSRNKFPRIRSGFLGNRNSASVALSFLKYGLVSAEEFIIEQYAFENVHKSQIASVLKECKWENLVKFELMIKTRADEMKLSRKQVTTMSSFLEFARIPCLKEFIIHLNHNSNLDDDGSLFQKFCSDLFGFMNRHSETLKSLSWELERSMLDWSQVSSVIQIPDNQLVPPIPTEIMKAMCSNLKLETYSVRTPPDHSVLSLALSSVCGSDSLTSFKAEIHNHYSTRVISLSPESSEAIEQILQRNSKTLTDIYIRSPSLDMNVLRNCHKLKSLFIGVGFTGVTNLSAAGVNFPELKSFEFLALNSENSDLDAWIVEKMPMVEKIKFTTFPAYLSVPLLQNLVNGLSRLKEITVLKEIALLSQHLQGHDLNTYCNDTEGLTLKYIDISETSSFVFRCYMIEIVRKAF